ncbi:helix-turn-helix domain-containing protein [Paenibacillus sp. VTT E-133291]|nr:helix-turn-helix domain-containing protein [Paenibacillus sp. VTT E-133291]MBY3618618.1 helix-turn-helix domain-containing protein [Acinetobacter sp. CUI P1]OZQ97260.1 hypothetical protein CA598_06805 [Paenibacillus sp. VTT E-133291]
MNNITKKALGLEKRFGLSPNLNNSYIAAIPDDALLTPTDISNVTGLSTRQIRRYCESGQLRTYCFGRKYVIYGVDFKNFMKDSIVRGRTLKELIN